jgi:hypothetical protein
MSRAARRKSEVRTHQLPPGAACRFGVRLGSKARLSGTPAGRQVYPRKRTFMLHVGKVSNVPPGDMTVSFPGAEEGHWRRASGRPKAAASQRPLYVMLLRQNPCALSGTRQL